MSASFFFNAKMVVSRSVMTVYNALSSLRLELHSVYMMMNMVLVRSDMYL